MKTVPVRSSMLGALLVIVFVFGGIASAFASDASGHWYQATGPLQPGVSVNAAIDTDGDIDWYHFYTSSNGQVKVGLTSSGDPSRLRLYRWDGGHLSLVDSISHSELIDKLLPAGLYYIRVEERYSWDTGGAYSITVSGTHVVGARPSGVQPHPASVAVTEDYKTGWTNSAGPLAPTRPYVAAIETDGDVDWYHFYNASTGQVKVGLNSWTDQPSRLRLYRWDGGHLASVDTIDGSALIDKQLSAGLHYIRVEARYSWDTGGPYDLTVSGTNVVGSKPKGVQGHPSAVIVTEDYKNTTAGARGPMVPTRPYAAAIDTDGDIDWYYFYASSIGQVKVGLNSWSDQVSSLELFAWNGGGLASLGSISGSGLIDKQLPAGLYYIRLQERYSWDTGGPYDCTVVGRYVTVTSPVTLGISAPRSAKRSARLAVAGTLKSIRGARLKAKTVTLQRSFDRKTWRDVTSIRTSSAGSYSFTQQPTRTTYYRVRFAGDSAFLGKTSAVRRVVVK